MTVIYWSIYFIVLHKMRYDQHTCSWPPHSCHHHLCDVIQVTSSGKIKGDLSREYLRNVQFPGVSQDVVALDANQDLGAVNTFVVAKIIVSQVANHSRRVKRVPTIPKSFSAIPWTLRKVSADSSFFVCVKSIYYKSDTHVHCL